MDISHVNTDSPFYAYQSLDLFNDVDLTTVEHLLVECEEISVDSGDTLVAAGAPNNMLYGLLDGAVEVRLANESDDLIVNLEIGNCVGELSIISGVQASANVTATQSSRLLAIPQDLLWSFIASSHDFATNLLSVLAGRVRDDNVRLAASINEQQRYKRAARVDALTGLHNRRWFDDAIVRLHRRAKTDAAPLSAVFIDIDHFKSINDNYGHLVGDDVLRQVAGILQTGIRSMDIAARFGGEEFVLLLFGINVNEARQIAERLLREVRQTPFWVGPEELQVTISVGVTELEPNESAEAFIHAADAAMYTSKQNGRDQVTVRESRSENAVSEPVAA